MKDETYLNPMDLKDEEETNRVQENDKISRHYEIQAEIN